MVIMQISLTTDVFLTLSHFFYYFKDLSHRYGILNTSCLTYRNIPFLFADLFPLINENIYIILKYRQIF